MAALPLTALADAEVQAPAGSDAFTADLVREVVAANPGRNVVVSPFSVQGALAMAALGARGAARDRLQSVLGLGDLAPATVHEGFDTPLLKATRGVFARRVSIEPAYREAVARALGAQAHELPDEPRAAARLINAWADKATHHRIGGLVETVPTKVSLVLADAVYLNFRWLDTFDKSLTRDEPFHVTPERSMDVPMMHSFLRATAGPVDVGMVLHLRFEGRPEDGMHLVLPHEGTSPEAALDAVLRRPRLLEPSPGSALHLQQVDLSLPRFELRTTGSMTPALRRAGLAALFEHADFSGISPAMRNEKIGDVIQEALLLVDEKGVEAAAVTLVRMVAAAAVAGPPPPPPLKLVFDRPFALLIRDKATLFAAVVRDPSAKA